MAAVKNTLYRFLFYFMYVVSFEFVGKVRKRKNTKHSNHVPYSQKILRAHDFKVYCLTSKFYPQIVKSQELI